MDTGYLRSFFMMLISIYSLFWEEILPTNLIFVKQSSVFKPSTYIGKKKPGSLPPDARRYHTAPSSDPPYPDPVILVAGLVG